MRWPGSFMTFSFIITSVLLAGRPATVSAQSMEPGPARPASDVALERVEILAALGRGDAAPSADQPSESEAVGLARLALAMAGASAIEPLALRLDSAVEASASATADSPDAGRGGAAQAFAWALGESASQLPLDAAGALLRARATTSLQRVLWIRDWPARLSAASSLGLLEARAAELDLVALAVVASGIDDGSPGRDGALLLALAGVGGPVAQAMVNDALRAGGDIRWARAMMALHARLGATCWPDLVTTLEESGSEDVRTTAAAALLILAEPASACRVAEAYGREPNAAIRFTLLQALSATASPIARDALGSIASHEADERLARAASILAAASPETRLHLDPRVDSARVREALGSLAEGHGFPRDLRDVEGGATLLDLPLIEWTLRRLPLREDGAWIDDHARLAQVRARLLCATWPDGVPQGQPRVGRLSR